MPPNLIVSLLNPPVTSTQPITCAVHSNLTHSDRRKFKTIAVADVHARDIVDLFVEHHITDARQFQWLSRLRFYWFRDVDNIFIEHYTGVDFDIILSIAINFQLQFDSVRLRLAKFI